jgi:hypothetical protein
VSRATFTDCDFANAQLAKVDFQSSSFIRCRFAGLLREVMFYDRGFKTGKPDLNPMEEVDFSQAELRMVEFRHLDLVGVTFPQSSDHLIVHHYRCVLERAVYELQSDAKWRGLSAVMEHRLKWAGPRQQVGEFNRRDLVEMGGEAEADLPRVCCGGWRRTAPAADGLADPSRLPIHGDVRSFDTSEGRCKDSCRFGVASYIGLQITIIQRCAPCAGAAIARGPTKARLRGKTADGDVASEKRRATMPRTPGAIASSATRPWPSGCCN